MKASAAALLLPDEAPHYAASRRLLRVGITRARKLVVLVRPQGAQALVDLTAMYGKWSQLGVPKKGWSCLGGVDDLGAPNAICEMCEVQEIRYVHTMTHPDYAAELNVGCMCAEKMEDDYVRPRLREKALRSAAGRKKRWLSRKWQTSARGNAYINTDGFNITIYPNRQGSWGGRIKERDTERFVASNKRYPTEDAAKLAAFDGMIFLKTKHGWGA